MQSVSLGSKRYSLLLALRFVSDCNFFFINVLMVYVSIKQKPGKSSDQFTPLAIMNVAQAVYLIFLF